MNVNGSRNNRYIIWSEYDHLLGTLTDQELSKLIGCSAPAVYARRKQLNVPPKIKSTKWSAEQNAEYAALAAIGKRRCSLCKNIKNIDQFHRTISRKASKDGYNYRCKQCRAEYQASTLEKVRSYWRELAGGICQRCGWAEFAVCLEFHHILREEKGWSPGHLIMSRPAGHKEVFDELDKCVLLCANCHQAIHRGELRVEFVKRDGLGWTLRK